MLSPSSNGDVLSVRVMYYDLYECQYIVDTENGRWNLDAPLLKKNGV